MSTMRGQRLQVRRLQPASLLGREGIERFYRQVAEAVAGSCRSERLALDLSSLDFIFPEGIIALTTVGRLWHRVTGRPVELQNLLPEVHRYMERMDLFSTCGTWLEEERPLPANRRLDRSSASQNLLEVLPIAGREERNTNDVLMAVTRANAIVGAWFDADPPAVNRLLTMLSEVTSNITHSMDRGFATIQHYRGGGARRGGGRVSMAVGDLGIGIEASLRTKTTPRRPSTDMRLETGSDYILNALQLGVTSRNMVAGTGLYRVRSLVEDWHGTLVIRSGRSEVRITAEHVEVRDDLADIPGTQVTITVRGSSKGLA